MSGKLDNKSLALTLKKEFDTLYGLDWHCIVGTSFGSYLDSTKPTKPFSSFLSLRAGFFSPLLLPTPPMENAERYTTSRIIFGIHVINLFVIGHQVVYQPSHEEYQQTEKKMQNKKAWAEMYLLSLTDKRVTSSWSTFGYVAQGLGGLKQWILYKPENATAPDPLCVWVYLVLEFNANQAA
ncbi:hypothetical protein POM88_030272 [Heracleum sosnowskyi]|uniref:Fucosyltransferase n=1 Tax=Heracleum sosnowskyi TaxID=360622 RepID=A0AAD8HVB0_9APIA|nr:hypothetical protein POM88_030272 [Heracleum sosnowskyi]